MNAQPINHRNEYSKSKEEIARKRNIEGELLFSLKEMDRIGRNNKVLEDLL